jgi:hypothetical protein
VQHHRARADERAVLDRAPSRWARWPTTQRAPITVACSAVACTTVPSCTLVPAPTSMRP